MNKDTDAKIHIEDPMGELPHLDSELKAEPKGNPADSANARAAAMKDGAGSPPPAGVQGAPAAKHAEEKVQAAIADAQKQADGGSEWS